MIGRRLLRVSLVLGVAGSLVSCGRKQTEAAPKSSAAPAATVSRPIKEEDLATITLTPEAEARLGIVTDRAKRVSVNRSATYAAEVVVRDGGAISVFTPFTGVIVIPTQTELRGAGSAVKRGEPLFRIEPILTPERSVLTDPERESVAQARTALALAKVDATAEAERATIDVQAAEVALERARKLVADEAGSARAVDEATVVLDRAKAALRTASRKEAALQQITAANGRGEAPGLEIKAPQDGTLRDLRVTPGQIVPAGALLCTVVSLDVVWVRVPVPVAEAGRLVPDRPAEIGPLARQSGSPRTPAAPVGAPRTADPVANTVDWYFEVANQSLGLRPGERVSATLPVEVEATSIAVPSSAILYDIHGGTWVYVVSGPHQFQNRRVVVRETSGGSALIDRGLDEGAAVVVTGGAELFGTQFGSGK